MNLLSSLTNRIFLASALLVVAAIGIAILRVNTTMTRQAEADLSAGLAESAALVDALSRAQFADFVVKGQLIADLPVLKAAAALDDPPTVQPIAQEYQTKIGADLFVVTGRGDRPLARAGRVVLDNETIANLVTACRARHDGTSFWPFEGGLLHAAMFPMEAGLTTLLVGVSLDRQAALRIKEATHSEIAFVSGSRLVASTFEPDLAGAISAVASQTGVFLTPVGQEIYIARSQPLSADPAGPVALVLRSRTEHLRFLPALRWQIIVTGLAAVLVATVVGYLVARTVTRPVRALTATMREMAATGDLARAVPSVRPWDDEDARLLAATFRQLTAAIDRFQKEAAQRERLSSLGRLSTVVAHEIRNPLMIIKGAVRTLRRQTAPDVVELASSIDEEVARLNRVVTGVLDFARPITLDLAPDDLATICQDAAQAARASAEDLPIAVDTADLRAAVVTDAERVRAVLVNVLGNAQQAVRAAGRPIDGTSICMRLRRAGDGRWRIDVADTGGGIAPDDLPRIFDPFFTTRRGGSGLGLAIARNIIEGLGGTITIESQLGAGTTVRIELPDRAPGAEVRP